MEFTFSAILSLLEPRSLLTPLHTSNPVEAKSSTKRLHAMGLTCTSSTLTHGKHYESFPTLEVKLICMPMDPLSITSYGLMNLGLNLPFFPNLIIFFQGDTFKNTFHRSHIEYPFFSCRRRIFFYPWPLSIFL